MITVQVCIGWVCIACSVSDFLSSVLWSGGCEIAIMVTGPWWSQGAGRGREGLDDSLICNARASETT